MPGLFKIYEDICFTCDYLFKEISKIKELRVIGKPRGPAIAFKWADKKNPTRIFVLSGLLKKRGWTLPTI